MTNMLHGSPAGPCARVVTGKPGAAVLLPGLLLCWCQREHQDLPQAARLVAWLPGNCQLSGLHATDLAAAVGVSVRVRSLQSLAVATWK